MKLYRVSLRRITADTFLYTEDGIKIVSEEKLLKTINDIVARYNGEVVVMVQAVEADL